MSKRIDTPVSMLPETAYEADLARVVRCLHGVFHAPREMGCHREEEGPRHGVDTQDHTPARHWTYALRGRGLSACYNAAHTDTPPSRRPGGIQCPVYPNTSNLTGGWRTGCLPSRCNTSMPVCRHKKRLIDGQLLRDFEFIRRR